MTPPNEQMTNGNVLMFLKKYWFIVAFIIGVAMGWANLERDISFNTEVNAQQEVSIQANEEHIEEVILQSAKDITFIKTTLEQLAK